MEQTKTPQMRIRTKEIEAVAPISSTQAVVLAAFDQYDKTTLDQLQKKIQAGISVANTSIYWLPHYFPTDERRPGLDQWHDDCQGELGRILLLWRAVQTTFRMKGLASGKVFTRIDSFVQEQRSMWLALGFYVDTTQKLVNITRGVDGGMEGLSYATPKKR